MSRARLLCAVPRTFNPNPTLQLDVTVAEPFTFRGYYLGNSVLGSVVGDCLSDVSAGMLLTYASTSADKSHLWHTETTSLTRGSTVGAIAIVGWNIKLTTPTTIETTTPSSATTPFNPTPTSKSIPAMSSSSPSPSSSSNNASQISPGVAAGIGVGVGLGVIGTALLLVILCRIRRRKRRSLAEAPQTHHQDNGAILAQPTPHELHVHLAKHELQDQRTGRHELQGFQNSVQGQYRGPPTLAELHE